MKVPVYAAFKILYPNPKTALGSKSHGVGAIQGGFPLEQVAYRLLFTFI